MKRLVTIIGREGGPWFVDLSIDRPSVSRQHAVIYFKENNFVIKCLSKKNALRVDNLRVRWGEPQVSLKNLSLIRLGGEKMIFLLPEQ